MAEVWLNTICGEYFEAQSAGLEPGTLNPLAVQVMAEAGIDISKKKNQAVFDVFKSGQLFAYVITVCDETSAERCPNLPRTGHSPALDFSRPFHRCGAAKKRNWGKSAPSATKSGRRLSSGAKRSVYEPR